VANRSARVALAGAVAYVIGLLLVGLWPTHVDGQVDVLDSAPARWLEHRGISAGRTYWLIETGSNVLLFVPFGVLAMLLSVRLTVGRTVLLGLVFSGAIEIAQAVVRPGRTASAQDVVANVLGVAIGAGLVAVWRRRAAD
jgi:VanZ family protein